MTDVSQSVMGGGQGAAREMDDEQNLEKLRDANGFTHALRVRKMFEVPLGRPRLRCRYKIWMVHEACPAVSYCCWVSCLQCRESSGCRSPLVDVADSGSVAGDRVR